MSEPHATSTFTFRAEGRDPAESRDQSQIPARQGVRDGTSGALSTVIALARHVTEVTSEREGPRSLGAMTRWAR